MGPWRVKALEVRWLPEWNLADDACGHGCTRRGGPRIREAALLEALVLVEDLELVEPEEVLRGVLAGVLEQQVCGERRPREGKGSAAGRGGEVAIEWARRGLS